MKNKQKYAWYNFFTALLCIAVITACMNENDRQATQIQEKEDTEQLWPAEPTEDAQNGTYFVNLTQNIPPLDEGGEGRIRKYTVTAIIYEDYMTLTEYAYNRGDVFMFTREGDEYIGENIRAKISLKFLGDILTVKITAPSIIPETRIIQLVKNHSIGLAAEEPVQLLPPENVVFYPRLGFSWGFNHVEGWNASLFYLLNNGILGAGFEIKYDGAEDFTAVSINDFTGGPVWKFFLDLHYLSLPQGTHIAKIRHIGGPFVQWDAADFAFIQKDEGTIKLSVDSEPLYFKLTVDKEDKISAEEISYQQ